MAWLDRAIAIDPTNHHPYSLGLLPVPPIRDPVDVRLQLGPVGPSEDYWYEGGQTSFNLAVYDVEIDSSDFGHEINAVLIGDNPLTFSDWLFIEPQTDTFVNPGDWDMPFGTNAALAVPQFVESGRYIGNDVVTFSVDQAGASLVSSDPGLVLVRQVPGTLPPENRPSLWNPLVLETGSGLLLFHRTRDDLSRVADLHVAALATAGSGSAAPLTGSAQFSRNLDAFRGSDGRFHLLWFGGQDYIPSLFYGVFDPVTGQLSPEPPALSAFRTFPREARVLVTTAGLEIHVFWL